MEEHIRQALVSSYAKLQRFALSLTGAQDRGSDLVHLVCERALERAAQWHPSVPVDLWLYRIMHNAWLDEMRSASRRSRADVEEAADVVGVDGVSHAENRNLLAAVQKEMMRLPAEQRAVLTLVCVDGLSYREAAEIVGVPIGTVMSRIARGRLALAEKLDIAGRKKAEVAKRQSHAGGTSPAGGTGRGGCGAVDGGDAPGPVGMTLGKVTP